MPESVTQLGSRIESRAVQQLLRMESVVFFDRIKIEDPTKAAQLRAMSKMGAFIRRRAQTSMRRRKRGASRPGTPPNARVGYLRDYILFAYDPETDSVVVGPIVYGRSSGGKVPATHEFGGMLNRKRPRRVREILAGISSGQRWKAIRTAKSMGVPLRTYARQLPGGEHRVNETVRYPKRPYMGPALAAEAPKFAGQFAGSMGSLRPF
jgi:hypothetical protein